MPDRRIHSLWKMVAIHSGDRVWAVTREAFGELVDACLPELNQLEKISFKMAASPLNAAGLREHAKKIPAWEALLVQRLAQRLESLGHLLIFSISGPEVPEYLADTLEGYRGNHIGSFAFSIDEVHTTKQRLLALQAYDEPSLWQRVTKAERDPRQRLVIPVTEIDAIIGTSVQLELKCRTATIRLGRDGSIISKDC